MAAINNDKLIIVTNYVLDMIKHGFNQVEIEGLFKEIINNKDQAGIAMAISEFKQLASYVM